MSCTLVKGPTPHLPRQVCMVGSITATFVATRGPITAAGRLSPWAPALAVLFGTRLYQSTLRDPGFCHGFVVCLWYGVVPLSTSRTISSTTVAAFFAAPVVHGLPVTCPPLLSHRVS